MIRVAVCDQSAPERRRVRNALERCANEAQVHNVHVAFFATVEAAVKVAARMRPDYFDIAFCRIDAAGAEQPGNVDDPAVLQALRGMDDLRGQQPDVRLIAVSSDTAQAFHAFGHDAGFLLLTGTYADFVRAVEGALVDVAAKNTAVLTVKTSGGVQNVMLADIQFVEHSKRGPIIHLPAGKTVLVRGTLQNLFDNLSAQDSGITGKGAGEHFVKAGSSFIVNLDNVRSAGEGSLVFADGETIIVPVRKRKAVLDALQAYWDR